VRFHPKAAQKHHPVLFPQAAQPAFNKALTMIQAVGQTVRGFAPDVFCILLTYRGAMRLPV